MVGTPFWSEQFRANAGSRPFIIHPALRFAVFLALIVIPLCIAALTPLLILFAYLAAIAIYSRIPTGLMGTAVRAIAPFIVLIVLLNLLFARIGGGSPVPWHGLSRGLVYGLRILDLYAAVLIWIATTSQEEMAGAAASLAAPFSPHAARKIALFSFISFGFLPVFFEEYERIKIAQRFRGGKFSGGLYGRLAGARAVLIPLLVSAIRRSAQLSMAVELRSVRNSIEVLIAGTRPTAADVSRTLVTAGVLFALLYTQGA